MSTTTRCVLDAFRNEIRLLKSQRLLDSKTTSILVNELKKRVRRNQVQEVTEIKELFTDIKDGKKSVVQKVLKRCYLQGRYWDHEIIRYFLKAKISSWPSESLMLMLKGQKNTLEIMAKNYKKLQDIKFPEEKKRELPSMSDIMNIDNNVECSIQPLEIVPVMKAGTEEEKLNQMLTKVLTLFNFLNSTSFIHARSLKSPIVVFPITPVGDDIADCRKKNLIRKKIAYIRNLFIRIPPLEWKDSKYLTDLVDNWYDDQSIIRDSYREYKKFIRKSYTIDKDFNILLNKYSKIQADYAPRNDIFDSQSEFKKKT